MIFWVDYYECNPIHHLIIFLKREISTPTYSRTEATKLDKIFLNKIFKKL